MIKIGIVGCGAIGSYLAKTIHSRYKGIVRISGICDIDKSKIIKLQRFLKTKIKAYSLAKLAESCDLLIEAANGNTAQETAKQALKSGRDVMIMSVGGLLNNTQLIKKFKKSKSRIYIPSGAIAGLDALKAAKMGKIKSVSLTTKKPIAGLEGAPYLKKQNIDLKKIKKEQIIFKGTAEKAVVNFPKNVNVAAILSLAGVGAVKTRVTIVASRKIERNTHTIEIRGDFGTIISCTENVPSRANPKTSMLAMLSAMATLEGILKNAKIGT